MSHPPDRNTNEKCCQKEDECIVNNCGTPVVGETVGALIGIAANTITRLPLTTVIFKTPGIKIPQDGGITVQEDGEYFISFNGSFTLPAAPATTPIITFSVFTPNFSGTALTASTTATTGIATLAELVCLRAGDTVYVTVRSSTILASATGILVVAKVED
ncbi:hypothetical protein [Priestia megaterium]|uniref:hypothetical protein n=1 Tax=Priestia megaterium TaxID=1404 RepID=UPI000CA1129F|nr:hypothetical protein [Priestia megaterium]AUO13969.1 hypothetical protein C0569_22595 [Priestia megaterium]PVE74489.1 hypothetical protein DC428_00850 [Priestia megaterium]PVE82424.1 hypothetical protein DC421_20040 [Priestia megaterium]PVE87010.1 hypothetical protein DC426_17045 [Priestia megaterium]PVE94541.1 hypothetical protein DC433_24190 [Priestia megaterium]